MDGCAGARLQLLRQSGRRQPLALCRGTPVGPGHERAERPPAGVHRDEPVEQGTEADRDDPVAARAALPGDVDERLDRGLAQPVRVELGPAGPGYR
jgi:hypothetical protein